MGAYSELQQDEFAAEADGFTAVRHQREVGVSYFDAVATAASGGQSSTTALARAAPKRPSSTTRRPRPRRTTTTTAWSTPTPGRPPAANKQGRPGGAAPWTPARGLVPWTHIRFGPERQEAP